MIYIYTVLFFFFLLFENNTCIGFFRLLFLFCFVLFGMKESSSLSLLTFLSKVFCAYARIQYAWRHTYVCSFPPPTQAAKQIYYLLHFKKHIILKTRQTYKKKHRREIRIPIPPPSVSFDKHPSSANLVYPIPLPPPTHPALPWAVLKQISNIF